ncbi:hypothetical protein HW132_12905 [Brasilonema sp. CT11]|nr:hypothetical protein [Brasilonema sp. CT11]
MPKILASFQSNNFSPVITNLQAMAEVIGVVRSLSQCAIALWAAPLGSIALRLSYAP